ncbi:hypothetical protein THAOC_04194 [Thalassiosira oceanica]|uniref:HYR domain-containing protein n=1 Tax=Thalassiosira oceanica TaxID=159749 RepID=K0TP52_THAOC|nr:hypothetical protein THAOC_04194 [Thalassiosira oceanica]|eukprot:EJK74147.1 hypothetical protein THAOC_04194 [Thalassiosira oceanica]
MPNNRFIVFVFSPQPSDHPSVSIWPTGKPSSTPSVAPSEMPSWTPSSDPTESPTRFPSQSPVSRCPPSYDKTRTDYAAGDRVEIFSTIYECKEFPYQPYCNIADESVLRKYEKDYWNDAWSLIGPCDDSFPSKSPSYAPTSVEHAVSVGIIRKWYPDLFVDENLCRYDDYYPLWMSFDSNKEDYLFDSRDECCSQFPCETASPTSEPSTIEPSRQPTESPTESPTEMASPTNSPSTSPSLSPTNSPSSNPTASPSSDLAPIIRPFQNGRGVLGAFGEDIVLFCEAFDPEGHELTYQWGVNCGTGAEFIENEDTNRPTLRIPQGLDPGSTCEFTVSVCDRPNRCTSENGSIAILNSDPEASCVVNATVEATDESCSAFAEVDFGSSDADGSILERTYEPAGPYQVTGGETTYDVILTVLDAHGEIDSCSAQVTVTNAAPQVQLEDVFFVYLNGEIDDTEENGNLSVTATDDQTLSYQWSLDERCDTDEVSISGADTNFPHVTIMENSDMKVCGVSCRVCDSCGACSESSASIIARRSPTPSPNTPTSAPSTTVSEIPSFAESNKPSSKSDQPSLASSNVPSLARSTFPSLLKSESPSLTISELPSLFGSTLLSNPPSVMPSGMPLKMPGEIPTLRLSAHPTQMQQPTSSPSHEELDLVGICPDAYDATKTSSYSAGSLVEVMQIVYKCQEYPYAHFCTLESFAPQSNQSLWRDAWAEVGVCVRVPSLSPTDLPSSTPITNKATRTPTNLPSSAPITINPTRGPSELPTFAPITNKPTRRPTRRPSANPSLSPTTHMPSGNPTPDQEWLELVSKFPYTWPHRRFKYWIELDGDDRLTARKQLGYSRNTWNNLQTAVVESKIFVDLEESEQVGLNMLDISADQWDCFMNHYSGIYWEDLVKKDVARYYEVLGWNQEWWDNGTGQPETEDVYWDGLTPDQQEAAYKLCYFEKSWEWLELSSW